MARKIGFDDAVKLLREMRLLPEEEAQDTDYLEKAVLRHTPLNLEEAAVVLEEVAYNLEAGERSDGLDVSALTRVGSWLRQVDADVRIKTAASVHAERKKAA